MSLQHSLFDLRRQPSDSQQRPPRRNIVIDAGAGTGKTTAIVGEVLSLLLSNEALSPDRIVLMTFTEKAAGEIADRIHAALAELSESFDDAQVQWPRSSLDPVFIVPDGDRDAYRRACSAQLARVHLLRSQTIHSFCQTLLRLFPIEAGLDPQFRIIEGFERSLLYGELYDAWIDRETRASATDDLLREWEVLFTHAGYLFRIRDMIFSLVDRGDILEETDYDLGDVGLVDSVLRDLLSRVPPPGTQLGRRPKADAPDAEQLQRYVKGAPLPPAGATLEQWLDYLAPIANIIRTLDLDQATGGFREVLRGLRASDKKGDSFYDRLDSHRGVVALHSAARRFIAFLDAEKQARGVVDFDDLLLRTHAVLRHDSIAAMVRAQYDHIFVDEFQDTDRIQARIVDILLRDDGGAFVPGKGVIVGDPKQSIYGFRRADPETYHQTTDALLRAGAESRRLTRQHRTDPELLRIINEMFGRLMPQEAEDPNVFRPDYQPLTAVKPEDQRWSLDSPVTMLCAETDEKNDRSLVEARAIAAWIQKNRSGAEGDLRSFAILFRRMTIVDDYLDVLSAAGIDAVLQPSSSFLERRAPVDLLTVLRAIAWPGDLGAKISAARTPYFALTDEEIATGVLRERPDDLLGSACDDAAWRKFCEALEAYREASRQLTVSALIDAILDGTGADSFYRDAPDGNRSLRHLEHLRAIAFEYDTKTGGSVRQFVTEIDRRREEPEEMEPLIVDETRNAVTILTIHAAKGLEFDTVILPDLGFSTGYDGTAIFTVEEPRSLVFVNPDSLSARFRRTAGGAELRDVGSEREKAELKRLFYVGVTRARHHVVFVCGKQSGSKTFAGCIHETTAIDLKNISWPEGREIRSSPVGPIAFERLIAERRSDAAQGPATPVSGDLAPIDIDIPALPVPLSIGEVRSRRASSRNREAGILLHRILEIWDGATPIERLLRPLAGELGASPATVDRVRKRLTAIGGSPVFRRILAAETVAREMPIRYLDAGGVVVARRIDRLIRDADGEIVVDYKSGSPADSDRDQVAEYCRAVGAMTGRPCRGLIWYVETDVAVDVVA